MLKFCIIRTRRPLPSRTASYFCDDFDLVIHSSARVASRCICAINFSAVITNDGSFEMGGIYNRANLNELSNFEPRKRIFSSGALEIRVCGSALIYNLSNRPSIQFKTALFLYTRPFLCDYRNGRAHSSI